MNGRKDPCSDTKVFHMGSKIAMIVAAVLSKLNLDWASGESNWANEAIGGPFRTFKPAPMNQYQNRYDGCKF